MSKSNDVVHSRPSKDFFIDMITRDLGIIDCILDLVDNALDKAVESQELDVMTILTNGASNKKATKCLISMTLSDQSFRIDDTCGGISIEEAKNKMFLFGDSSLRSAGAGLSVYGIGMKRAFFKLGRMIRIQSATKSEFFIIDIDVDEWKAKGDEDWDFKFTSHGPLHKRIQTKKSATKIRIERLNKTIADRFSQTSFFKDLIKAIAATYSLFIESGIRIRVNSKLIKSSLPKTGSGSFTPARRQFSYKGVDILIIATLSPKDDHNAHGWYVFCNGRLVLNADKTAKTGWGNLLPQFHSKYNHFVGYVYFRSDDVRLLPWTTTKQDILQESETYQKALVEMQIQARPVLNFLNRLYPGEQEPEGLVERDILEEAEEISIDKIEKEQAAFLYKAESTKKGDKGVNIKYKKPFEEVEKIRKHLGKSRMSSSRVGAYTFEYFLKQECE